MANIPDAQQQLQPPLLFIQNIFKGSYFSDVLKFEMASPQIIFISTQPYIITGLISTEHFLEMWETEKATFKDHPPQGVLSCFIDGNVQKSTFDIFSIAHNNYKLSYKIKPISGMPLKEFGHASLFIDPFYPQKNEQLADPVTQTNVKVLGDAPDVAMGNLYQVVGQALANAAHNATQAQQQTNIIAQAAAQQGIDLLYSLDTASTGIATKKILGTD